VGVPILDQGREGACTGFGLATVAHYLLRRRQVVPDDIEVSPRMFYDMAKRYDEWPGENYEGSSARGAMKGWHKHGVCSGRCWPYADTDRDEEIFAQRWSDAMRRPLGAYYRVNHRDLVAMHSAIAEVGVLYATSTVHEGWKEVESDGVIPLRESAIGGHAFAIVAYDANGFWIQNSWGERWGKGGFGLLSYDDWLANGTDVWVARLGAPVVMESAHSTAVSYTAAAKGSRGYAFCDLRPHIISIGNDGRLRAGGTFGTAEADVSDIFTQDFPRITKDWSKRRLLLYAHGGLVPEDSAIQRVADYRAALLDAEVYPISFIWKSDYWTTLTDILQDALRSRRPEGFLDNAKDFMLDRLDDALEPLLRALTGKAQWDEMRENALLATIDARGGARVALKYLSQLLADDPSIELHVAGHSAGSIFHAPLVQLLTSAAVSNGPMRGQPGLGRKVATCTLWAPACTMRLFRATYLPAIQQGSIQRFALFTLTDEAERDDNCAGIYHKSLLYLVSNALETRARIPGFQDGEPILGLEKFAAKDADLMAMFLSGRAHWIKAPNTDVVGSPGAARAVHHGDFDDDNATLQATLVRIVGQQVPETAFSIHRSAAGQRSVRTRLMEAEQRS
jgi:hypothetical protein